MQNTLPKEESKKQDQETYANFVNLQAVHSEASARLSEMENDLQQKWLSLVDEHRKDYARLQQAAADAEEGIEYLASVNPQWFVKARTIKTPYGKVQFRKTTKLEVKNPELSVVLLKQLGQDSLPFLVVKEELNLEALEKLTDQELERLKIKRITTDSCTVTPIKIDLGKAVKAAAAESVKGGAK